MHSFRWSSLLRLTFISLLLSVVARPSEAATVGQTTPVTAPSFVPDGRTVTHPRLAVGGSMGFLVWEADEKLFLQRYDATGTALDVVPRVVGPGREPVVTFDGTNFVMVYRVEGTAQQISLRTIAPTGETLRVVTFPFFSNGNLHQLRHVGGDFVITIGREGNTPLQSRLVSSVGMQLDFDSVFGVGALMENAGTVWIAESNSSGIIGIREFGENTDVQTFDVGEVPAWIGLAHDAQETYLAWTTIAGDLFVTTLSSMSVPAAPVATGITIQFGISGEEPPALLADNGSIFVVHDNATRAALLRVDVAAQTYSSTDLDDPLGGPAQARSVGSAALLGQQIVMPQGERQGQHVALTSSSAVGVSQTTLASVVATRQRQLELTRLGDHFLVTWLETTLPISSSVTVEELLGLKLRWTAHAAVLDASGTVTQLHDLGAAAGVTNATDGSQWMIVTTMGAPSGSAQPHSLDATGTTLTPLNAIADVNIGGNATLSYDGANWWFASNSESVYRIAGSGATHQEQVVEFNYFMPDQRSKILGGGPDQAVYLETGGGTQSNRITIWNGADITGSSLVLPSTVGLDFDIGARWDTDAWWVSWVEPNLSFGHRELRMSRVDLSGSAGPVMELIPPSAPYDPIVIDSNDGRNLLLVWRTLPATGQATEFGQPIDKQTMTLTGAAEPLAEINEVVIEHQVVMGPGNEGLIAAIEHNRELEAARLVVRTLTTSAPDGATCAADNECGSFHCQDAICCDRVCGPCEECRVGDNGATCEPVVNATDDLCFGDSICSEGGECLSANGQSCSGNAECASDVCLDNTMCCDSACDGPCEVCGGDGICQQLLCGAYQCGVDDGGAKICLSACQSSADCAEGHQCDSRGECIVITPVDLPMAEDGCGCRLRGASRDNSGSRGWLALLLGTALAWRVRRRAS